MAGFCFPVVFYISLQINYDLNSISKLGEEGYSLLTPYRTIQASRELLKYEENYFCRFAML